MDDMSQLITLLQAQKMRVQAAANTGVFKAGLLVEGDAKRLCPVDTGRLRSSITTEKRFDGDKPVASVGSNVEYGLYVEFGTGQNGDPSVDHRVDWAGQPPKPFMRPAMHINQDNISRIVGNEVRKVLK